jgi:hypothetical protein
MTTRGRNANGYGLEVKFPQVIEALRNPSPPPRVERTCIGCGEKFLVRSYPVFGGGRSSGRCLKCRDDAPRKRAAIANAERAARRAEARAGMTCDNCGKPIEAKRQRAGYLAFCGPTCRSQAWRAQR